MEESIRCSTCGVTINTGMIISRRRICHACHAEYLARKQEHERYEYMSDLLQRSLRRFSLSYHKEIKPKREAKAKEEDKGINRSITFE